MFKFAPPPQATETEKGFVLLSHKKKNIFCLSLRVIVFCFNSNVCFFRSLFFQKREAVNVSVPINMRISDEEGSYIPPKPEVVINTEKNSIYSIKLVFFFLGHGPRQFTTFCAPAWLNFYLALACISFQTFVPVIFPTVSRNWRKSQALSVKGGPASRDFEYSVFSHFVVTENFVIFSAYSLILVANSIKTIF